MLGRAGGESELDEPVLRSATDYHYDNDNDNDKTDGRNDLIQI